MPPEPEEHPIRGNPASYVTAHGKWPDGPFKDETPPEIRLSQAITRRLEEALARRKGTRDDAAAEARLAPATLHKLLYGTSWGRVPTIARLERILGTRLWDDEHFRPPPRSYIKSGEWPYGRLDKGAPPEARLAQAIGIRLQETAGRRGLKKVAELAGVSLLTVRDLCNGTFWGDLITIARLEAVLNKRLWGDEHRWEHRPRDYLDTGVWPEGRLVSDAPPHARLAQALVLRLHIASSKSSPEEVAQEARISPRVVHDLLDGTIWVDFAVIARLEVAGIGLWGSEHFQPVLTRTIKNRQRGI